MKTIQIEADTLEEAKAKIESEIPPGYFCLSETVVSDGKPKVSIQYGNTTDEAFQKARVNVPADAIILEEQEVRPSLRKLFVIEATDEKNGISSIRRQLGKNSMGSIEQVRLKTMGSTGFLGIGKKPNTYEIEVLLEKAEVEIRYQTKSKISLEIEEDEIVARMVDDIIRENDMPTHYAGTGPDGETYTSSPRLQATIKLGKIGHPHAIEQLIVWLGDSNAATREYVALALGKIGTLRAADALLDCAIHDSHFIHKKPVNSTISLAGMPKIGYYPVRCAAVIALQRIGADEVLRDIATVSPRTWSDVYEYKKDGRHKLGVNFGY